MASFTITRTGDDLTNLTPRFLEAYSVEGKRFMTIATEIVMGRAQPLTPIDRGFARNSLQISTEQTGPLTITGKVYSNLSYFAVIEGQDAEGNPTAYGRQPGARQPPSAALEGWVARKWGITDPKKIRGLAFVLARSIARRGIKAVAPIRRAVADSKIFLDQLFGDDFTKAIDKRMASRR